MGRGLWPAAPGLLPWLLAPRRGPGLCTTTAFCRAVCSKRASRRPRTAARRPAQVPEGSREVGGTAEGRGAPSAQPAFHLC